MPVELGFDLNVTGQQAMAGVEQAIARIQQSAKASAGDLKTLDYALKSGVQSGLSLAGALKEVSVSSETFSKSIRDAAGSLAAEDAAAKATTVTIQRLGSAHRSAVSEIQATSGALRELEGAMPLRAAERFVATTLGIGPVLQAAFPIIGLISFVEMLDKALEHLDPLKSAQDKLSKSTKELDKDYANLGKRLERLQIAEITDKFGKAAGANLASFYAESDLLSDKARIQAIGREIDIAKSKLAGAQVRNSLATGFFTGGIGALAGIYTQRDVAARQDDVLRLTDQQNFLKNRTTVDARQIDKDKSDVAKDLAAEANRKAAEEARGLAAALKFAADAAFRLEGRPLGIIERAERERDQAIAGVNEQFGGLSSRANRNRAGAQIASIQAASLAGIRTQLNAAETAQKTFDPLKAGDEYQNARDKEAATDDRGAAVIAERVSRDFLKTVAGIRSNVRKTDTQDIEGLRSAGNQAADLAILGAGQGDEVGAQAKALGIRQAAAQIEFQIKQAHSDIYDIDAERFKMERENNTANFDFQKQLLEMKKRQSEDTKNVIVGGIMAAQSGNAAQYFQNFAKQLEGQILGNVVGGALKGGTLSLPGTIGSDGKATGLGKILSGTIFGPDPTKLGGVDKVDTTNDWLAKIYQQLSGDPNATTPGAANPSSTLGGIGGILSATGGSTGAGIAKALSAGTSLAHIFSGTGVGSGEGKQYSGSQGGSAEGPDSGSGEGDGNYPSAAGSSGSGNFGKALGAGAAAYGAFRGISSGIHEGGAQGITGAVGAGLGGAAAIAALIPGGQVAALVLGAASLGASLVSSFMGDPRVNRENQINKELGNATYHAPTALNESSDMSGNYSDFDRFGNVRSSSLSRTPQVTDPYSLYRGGTYEQFPGAVISPFSQKSGSNVTIQINALDSKSVVAMAPQLADALTQHINTQGGNSSLVQALNYAQ